MNIIQPLYFEKIDILRIFFLIYSYDQKEYMKEDNNRFHINSIIQIQIAKISTCKIYQNNYQETMAYNMKSEYQNRIDTIIYHKRKIYKDEFQIMYIMK